MDKRTRITGGGLLLLAGGFFGRETLSWILAAILDLITAGMGEAVTWETFPWANATGVVLMIAGAIVLLWPSAKSVFQSPKFDDREILARLETLESNQSIAPGELASESARKVRKINRLAWREDGTFGTEEVDWPIPRLSTVDHDRVCSALAEAADLISLPLEDLIQTGRRACNFQKVVPTDGPAGLVPDAKALQDSIALLNDKIVELGKRRTEDLSFVYVSMSPIAGALSRLIDPARDYADFLSKAPPDWREPDFVKAHAIKLNTELGQFENSRQAVLTEIRQKRFALAEL